MVKFNSPLFNKRGQSYALALGIVFMLTISVIGNNNYYFSGGLAIPNASAAAAPATVKSTTDTSTTTNATNAESSLSSSHLQQQQHQQQQQQSSPSSPFITVTAGYAHYVYGLVIVSVSVKNLIPNINKVEIKFYNPDGRLVAKQTGNLSSISDDGEVGVRIKREGHYQSTSGFAIERKYADRSYTLVATYAGHSSSRFSLPPFTSEFGKPYLIIGSIEIGSNGKTVNSTSDRISGGIAGERVTMSIRSQKDNNHLIDFTSSRAALHGQFYEHLIMKGNKSLKVGTSYKLTFRLEGVTNVTSQLNFTFTGKGQSRLSVGTFTFGPEDNNTTEIKGVPILLYDQQGKVLLQNSTTASPAAEFIINDGQKYLLKVQDIGNYTFDSWPDNGSTNRTRIVLLYESKGLSAYYRNINANTTIGTSLSSNNASISINNTTNTTSSNISCGSTITKSITLTSNIGPCNTTTDGLIIGANNITLNCNGHSITGSRYTSNISNTEGIKLLRHSSDTIKNCNIIGFKNGFYLENSTKNMLIGNSALKNYASEISLYAQGNGFELINATDNELIGNNSTENIGHGFALYHSANNNTLIQNNASKNYAGSGFVVFADSDYNKLENNTASENNGVGFALTNAVENILFGNNATKNNDFGFTLKLSANNNTLIENTAVKNIGTGFVLSNADYNSLARNTVTENGRFGIYLEISNYNTLSQNTASKNDASGFWLDVHTANNSIRNNKADFNRNYGIEDNSSSTATANNTTTTATSQQQSNIITANTYSNNECHGNQLGNSKPLGLCNSNNSSIGGTVKPNGNM